MFGRSFHSSWNSLSPRVRRVVTQCFLATVYFHRPRKATISPLFDRQMRPVCHQHRCLISRSSIVLCRQTIHSKLTSSAIVFESPRTQNVGGHSIYYEVLSGGGDKLIPGTSQLLPLLASGKVAPTESGRF